MFAAISDTLEGEGGAYISNCRKTWVSSTANNEEEQDRLMKVSLEMLKIDVFGEEKQNGLFDNAQ